MPVRAMQTVVNMVLLFGCYAKLWNIRDINVNEEGNQTASNFYLD